jgi:hypothetical protein
MGAAAMSEAVFVLLTVWVLYLLVDADKSLRRILFATVLASLAYYVRPNGLFLLGTILLVQLYHLRTNPRAWYLLGVLPALFVVVSLPHLIPRALAFGSPLDFGSNSKYLVDSYAQVWIHNVQAPGLFEYLRTHTWVDYYERFVAGGLFKVLRYIHQVAGQGWPWLFYGGLAWLALVRWDKRFLPLCAMLLVYVAGLSLVVYIYGTPRHVFVLVPVVLILAAKFLSELSALIWRPAALYVALGAMLVIAGLNVQVPKTWSLRNFAVPYVKDDWAVWVADHLKGAVLVIEGRDLVDMSQPYAVIGRRNLAGAEKPLRSYHPGAYANLAEAMPVFEAEQVRYMVLDPMHIRRRPYLKDVYSSQWSDHFKHLAHFELGHQIRDVDVFAVRYHPPTAGTPTPWSEQFRGN